MLLLGGEGAGLLFIMEYPESGHETWFGNGT